MNMVESANTSANRNLLTARNAIFAAVGVLTLSLIWACATMLRPNATGGMARDSFGTRGDGFRALFEILGELQIPVSRTLAPPTVNENVKTFVMLAPDPQLVQFEPKYLTSLKTWIDNGGRLILAPTRLTELTGNETGRDIPGERDVLKLFGVDDVVNVKEHATSEVAQQQRRAGSPNTPYSSLREEWKRWNNKPPEPRLWQGVSAGSFAGLASDIRTIAVPGDEFTVLEPLSRPAAGSVSVKTDDGNELLLVAVVPRGKGEIIVVSDSAILSNMLIGRGDNSVLAARLLAPRGEGLAIDEYYHGLAVRGNPLFLLTRAGFAGAALAIVLVVAVTAWRTAIFLGPPLPDIDRSRRDIQEYVDAMGAFFCRGPGHRRFLVQEVRDGVLHELSEQLHLPPHTTDVGAIAAALARRDPRRADALRKIVAEVDGRLAQSGDYPKAPFLSSVQRLAGCL
jgi:hypothetical protein